MPASDDEECIRHIDGFQLDGASGYEPLYPLVERLARVEKTGRRRRLRTANPDGR